MVCLIIQSRGMGDRWGMGNENYLDSALNDRWTFGFCETSPIILIPRLSSVANRFSYLDRDIPARGG